MKKESVLLLFLGIALALMLIVFAVRLNTPAEPEHKDGAPIGNSVPMKKFDYQTKARVATKGDFKAEEFHISVVPYGNWGYWYIHFTNDNWESFEDLKENKSFFIDYGTILFSKKEEAVYTAKKLNSYQKCVDYNEKEYQLYENAKLQNSKASSKEVIIY